MPEPTLFLNIHNFGSKDYAESEVLTSRAAAIRDAEQWADRYQYTFTDIGKIDLSGDFSEGFQEKRDFDAAVDRKIDEMRELQSFTMQERA
jgi:hypothetical protein